MATSVYLWPAQNQAACPRLCVCMIMCEVPSVDLNPIRCPATGPPLLHTLLPATASLKMWPANLVAIAITSVHVLWVSCTVIIVMLAWGDPELLDVAVLMQPQHQVSVYIQTWLQ